MRGVAECGRLHRFDSAVLQFGISDEDRGLQFGGDADDAGCLPLSGGTVESHGGCDRGVSGGAPVGRDDGGVSLRPGGAGAGVCGGVLLVAGADQACDCSAADGVSGGGRRRGGAVAE